MRRTAFAACLILVPTVAFAHPGFDHSHNFVDGFMHPLSGLDHVLAMVAAGLFAAQLGGRALWLVPASFVVVMALAGMAGMTGFALPMVEASIALSVIVLGATIAFDFTMPTVTAMGMVAFFAIFHGYAHGTEMGQTTAGLPFGMGFVAATAALHALGAGLGICATKLATVYGPLIVRFSGSAAAMIGIVLLMHAI